MGSNGKRYNQEFKDELIEGFFIGQVVPML